MLAFLYPICLSSTPLYLVIWCPILNFCHRAPWLWLFFLTGVTNPEHSKGYHECGAGTSVYCYLVCTFSSHFLLAQRSFWKLHELLDIIPLKLSGYEFSNDIFDVWKWWFSIWTKSPAGITVWRVGVAEEKFPRWFWTWVGRSLFKPKQMANLGRIIGFSLRPSHMLHPSMGILYLLSQDRLCFPPNSHGSLARCSD